jgi:molecular chaperone HtpG
MSETQTVETHSFQTEVKQLLHLMVHSLYSNREIFLRELISNAADASDKLRFQAVTNADIYEGDADLKVRITMDKDAGTLTLSDNGIGMTHDEVIKNLGTIARSGTAEFLKNLSGDQSKDSRLIGQFGVGFYSAFIVADDVTVITRGAGQAKDAAVCWKSKGDGEFTIENVSKETRGTDIILKLKDDDKDLLEPWKIRGIVTKYSDHISVPVEMEKQITPEFDDEGNEIKKEAPATPEFESVNKATALWTRSRSDVSEDEYKEFYKHISSDFDEPLTWAHNRVEGKMEYTSLLYIPKRAPFDMWNRDRVRGVKLYVQRVFIMDDAEQFLPVYLRFARGLLDSNDLPLNVSREILQDSKVTQSLRNATVKRVLDMLTKMAKNDKENYEIFWKEFGQVLKEGIGEDIANKETIAKLLRFSSTHNDTTEQTVSLDDYISRMKEGQDKIYYISGETFNAIKNSSHLEIFRKKGIEVLLLSDRIDEWMLSHLSDYDGKHLQSVTRGDVDLKDLGEDIKEEDKEAKNKEFEPLIKRVAEVLGDSVKEVRLSYRLTNSPSCVVGDVHDMGNQMAQIMKAAGQDMPESKPIFEINPEHRLIQRLEEESVEDRFNDWVWVLFEQALLTEKGQIDDPATFSNRLNKLLMELSA